MNIEELQKIAKAAAKNLKTEDDLKEFVPTDYKHRVGSILQRE